MITKRLVMFAASYVACAVASATITGVVLSYRSGTSSSTTTTQPMPSDEPSVSHGRREFGVAELLQLENKLLVRCTVSSSELAKLHSPGVAVYLRTRTGTDMIANFDTNNTDTYSQVECELLITPDDGKELEKASSITVNVALHYSGQTCRRCIHYPQNPFLSKIVYVPRTSDRINQHIVPLVCTHFGTQGKTTFETCNVYLSLLSDSEPR